MEISRREFLRLLGVTTAGVSIMGLGCDSKWSMPDEMYKRIAGSPRIETWKTSVCSLCPGGCGIKVRRIDGIPVRILGNPVHPVNRGGICPMAEAGIEALFNPDRIKEPLKRVGARGEDQWKSISWEEAIQTVVARLQGLRENSEPHKLAFWSGYENSLLADLLERFMHDFGSPNLSVFGKNHLPALATYLTQGHKNPLGYNFKNVKLVINFGADLLDVGPSPVRFNQLYAELRSREGGKRAKIIHIDSRLSRTAGISHQWVPIRPETMAALALGMANVLIKDGQYDQDFVRTKSFGFDDWKDSKGVSHQGFKSLVEREYPPEKVAETTGVPASRIVELARDFGAAESALVLAGGQAANSSNGLYTLWAIECLNALKGNFKKGSPISFVEAPPFAALPHAELDAIAATGLRQPGITQSDGVFCFSDDAVAHLPSNILGKKPYPIDVLMLANVNPVFNSTGQSKFIAALEEIPFIVSFSPFVDETTIYADLILPDHSFLEKYEVFYNTAMVEFSHFGMQQPVVEPLFNTRNVGDVILQITHELGGAQASSFPWSNYQEYIQSRLEGVYKAGAGTLFTERVDDAWLKSLKERGWQIFEYTTFKEFWDVLLDKGGWLDPFPKKTEFSRSFKTPSRKYEFYSQILEEAIKSQTQDGALNQKLENWRVGARGDLVFLPHYETPKHENGNGEFDLHLLTYNLITNSNGMASNLPLMQELFGILTREYWQSWLEINPETAHKQGLSDGDMVKVTSHEGSLQIKVKILPGIMPDVVLIPFGLGHKAYGRYAKGIGVNPYEILTKEYDTLSGGSSLTSTKVILEKVSRKEHA